MAETAKQSDEARKFTRGSTQSPMLVGRGLIDATGTAIGVALS